MSGAAWSPDESLVVMITSACAVRDMYIVLSGALGDNKMLLMTQDFEVLSDVSIQTNDFGEGMNPSVLKTHRLANIITEQAIDV